MAKQNKTKKLSYSVFSSCSEPEVQTGEHTQNSAIHYLPITNTKTTRTDERIQKVAGYKVNIQKSVALLYTNNEILEKEYKNIIPYKITPPKSKYLGINLTKELKDLYAESY